MANLPEIQCVNGRLDLRKIDDVPESYRSVFAGYPHFNVIQSAVYNDVFYTDESAVVSAPTGSGKTVIFELAIVKLLLNWENEIVKDYKIVYISPTKALCEERLVDWHKKFSQFGVSCISVTGDSPNVDISTLLNSKLIITTPEKWDSLTRRWRDDERIVRAIKLFMIDEIHLLNDETRGPTLEAIVTRMKTIHSPCQVGMKRDGGIRLMGVSATISNVMDIAEWFGTSLKPAKYFKFEDSMRPVRLQKIVQGYPYNPTMSSPFKFDIMLSYKLHNVLLQHSSGKPSLVFCSTRKSVEMTCKQLIQNITIDLSPDKKQLLVQAASSLEDSKIKETLVHGVACHHAGMLPEDRRIVETLFREGNLPVLVTTSTLAMGVNLPAHLVVIKSTKYYANGEYKDYNESMLFQMIGRAGRPQFDSSAVAVIMTTAADKNKYENMISGEQPVESYLHKSLAEHVNAEVVLRTITDLSVAMHWLSSTFLYIRARKNPKNYSLPIGLSQAQLDKKLLEICQIEINKLAKAGMLTIDQNVLILPTRTGSLMAKYCAALDTMKLFTQVTGKEMLQQVLGLISKCREFCDIRLRTNDKRPLNILNQNRNKKTIRFPLSGRIKTLDMKINCIIQAVLGSLEISESSLLVEGQRIMRVGERLLNCFSEYFEGKENCYRALLNSITLAKCFHARIWENSPYVSRQLEGIGVTLSNSLVEAGKTTFKEILNSNPRDLERIINKKPPFGNRIQDQVKMLPEYDLLLKEVILDDGKVTIEITITLENSAVFKNDITVNPDSIMSLLVGDSENNVLLHEKYTHMYMIENIRIVKNVDVQTSFAHEVFANFISDTWVGIDAQRTIKLFVDEVVNNEGETAAQINSPTVEQEFPDSTNGNMKPATNIKKTERYRKSHMLQQFMDQYFKKVKTPKREIKTLQRRRSSNVLKGTTFTNLALKSEIENDTLSKELPNKGSSSTEDSKAKTPLIEPKESSLENNNNVVTDIINSAIDLYKQKSDFDLREKVPEETNIENDVVPSTPVLHGVKSEKKHLFRSGVRHLTKQRKHRFENMRTMELENSIYQDSKSHFEFSQYVKEPKKKVGEIESESEPKKLCLEKNRDSENPTKLISWSSPLVTSPKLKHSPCLPKDLLGSEKTIQKVNGSKQLISLKNNANVFSVADKDYTFNSEDQKLKYTDVWSQNFLNCLDVKITKAEDNVVKDTISSVNSANMLGQSSTKYGLNQTVSSASTESTNTSNVPKTKIIDSTTWYTQILKKSCEIKSKCVGSQTDDLILNTTNDSGVSGNQDKGKIEISSQNFEAVSNDIIREKIGKPTTECNNINVEPKLSQNQQKSPNREISFSRNNSWQEEFLSSEPIFDVGTTRQDYLSDPIVENPVGRRNQNNSFSTSGFDEKYEHFCKPSHNMCIQRDSDHQIRKRHDEEHWSWLDKKEVVRGTKERIPISNKADYISTQNVCDITTSERTNQNYLQQIRHRNIQLSDPTFEGSYHYQPHDFGRLENYNFHENLNNHSKPHNNLERIRSDININRHSNYPRDYNDFGNYYHHELYNQRQAIPHILPHDRCNNEYVFIRNKSLPFRNIKNLPLATERQGEDFHRTNIASQRYFENSISLPIQPSTSPLYENRNQSSDLNISYTINETDNKYQTYPDHFLNNQYDKNSSELGYLDNTYRRTCNKVFELDETESQNTNKARASNSFSREMWPAFMPDNNPQTMAYQQNNYPSFTYNAISKNSEFRTNRMELPYKENLNENYSRTQPRRFNLSAVGADNQNKNNFLISRYFQSYPKSEPYHFNRELLNLNHTITSEYLQDLNHKL